MQNGPAPLSAQLISTARQLLQYMFYNIDKVLVIDKTKGQRMQREPGAVRPGGLMMDTRLQLTPAPSLIFILVAMPFWPLLMGIFMVILCKLTGHS